MNYLDINLGTLKVSGKKKKTLYDIGLCNLFLWYAPREKKEKWKKPSGFTLIRWNMYSKGNNT